MQLMKTIALTACTMIPMTIATQALAQSKPGFFIEPGLTYELGKTKSNYSSWSYNLLNDATGEANGLGAVLRAGMHVNETLFLGLDGRYGILTYKDSVNNQSSEADTYTLARIIGVQMPDMGLRVWGGYIAASQLNPKQAGEYDFRFREGTGYLLGGGFRVSAVSLNLEYKNVTYKKTDAERLPTGASLTDREVTTTDQAWVASVSFPFEL